MAEHSHLAYFWGGGRGGFLGEMNTEAVLLSHVSYHASIHVFILIMPHSKKDLRRLSRSVSRSDQRPQGALGFTSGKPTTWLAPPAQNPQFWPSVRSLSIGDWLGVAKSREKFQQNNPTEVIQYPFLRNQSWAK